MYTFPSPYWDAVSDEAVDLVQGLLAQDVTTRLTVDETLNHIWMTMEVIPRCCFLCSRGIFEIFDTEV